MCGINPERKQILTQRSCRVCPVGPRQLLMAAPAQRGHHPGWGQPAQPWHQSRDTRLSLPLLAALDFRFQLQFGNLARFCHHQNAPKSLFSINSPGNSGSSAKLCGCPSDCPSQKEAPASTPWIILVNGLTLKLFVLIN